MKKKKNLLIIFFTLLFLLFIFLAYDFYKGFQIGMGV